MSFLLNSSKRAIKAISSAVTKPAGMPVRFFNIHEYQSKGLLKKFDCRVQVMEVASTSEEAEVKAKELLKNGATNLVIKAQVHAGGRGKGHFLETGFQSGVHFSNDPAMIKKYAAEMLGNHLVTKQTTAQGELCKTVAILDNVDFPGSAERYVAYVLDRSAGCPVLILCKDGGMGIEEVAEKNPSALKKIPINITTGPTNEQLVDAANFLGYTSADANKDAAKQLLGLYNAMIGLECTQVEINPFVQGDDGHVYSIDAKLNFDQNALPRHKEVEAMRDWSLEDPREAAAHNFDLNYVGLDGYIGCMVNGAGLAMATMDLIKLRGGEPANFLDVGGSAQAKNIEEAFKIILSDKHVRGVLVNIFGGIMKCDVVAEGVIAACKNIHLNVPVVLRLEGTNVARGKQLVEDSGLNITFANDLDHAARQIVALTNKN